MMIHFLTTFPGTPGHREFYVNTLTKQILIAYPQSSSYPEKTNSLSDLEEFAWFIRQVIQYKIDIFV